MNKNLVLYDRVSIPKDIAMEDIVRIRDKFKVVLWDSLNGGREPVIVDNEENFKVVDYAKLTKQDKKKYGIQ